MPIEIQTAWYTRQDIQNNPDKIYVWGDNAAQYGGANNPRSGQAYACRGEPNTFAIPTKRLPYNTPESFFDDSHYPVVSELYDKLFSHLESLLGQGKTIVWPSDGIGTGRAKLAEKSPMIWKCLDDHWNRLYSQYGQ